MPDNPYAIGLDKNPANYRAADAAVVPRAGGDVYPRRTSPSCTARAASPGRRPTPAAAGSPRRWPQRGIGNGDTVAAMLPNTPEMFECHFGVPMTGAVLNTLNTRLDAEAIAFMLNHGEAKVLITDREFSRPWSRRRWRCSAASRW